MAYKEVSAGIFEMERGRKYSIRVRIKSKETGKWSWSDRRKIDGNKAEAIAAQVAYKQELENARDGMFATVGEYVNAFQEKRRTLGKVSKRTLERDGVEIRRIVHYLGKIEITKLNAPLIEDAYVRMAKDGISKDAIHKAHMMLKRIMRKAYLDEVINRNPCDAVDGIVRPKQDPDKKKASRFSTQEAIRLAQVLQGEEQTGKIIATWLALVTGMRRGEVLALRWCDVDLDNSRIHVRKQLGRDRKLREPKTEKSKRTISIDGDTVTFLASWRDKQQQEFEKAGVIQNPQSPVCSNELCAFTDPDNFSRWRRSFYVKHGFARYSKVERWIDSRGIEREKKSGYIGPNFHALRHAQATLLVAGGVDPKTVQARLGHEKISTTLEIYAEAETANDALAAQHVGAVLSGIKG